MQLFSPCITQNQKSQSSNPDNQRPKTKLLTNNIHISPTHHALKGLHTHTVSTQPHDKTCLVASKADEITITILKAEKLKLREIDLFDDIQ